MNGFFHHCNENADEHHLFISEYGLHDHDARDFYDHVYGRVNDACGIGFSLYENDSDHENDLHENVNGRDYVHENGHDYDHNHDHLQMNAESTL